MISTATRGRRQGVNARERDMILDAPCYYCGSSFPTEVDHLIPFSRGGADSLDNFVPACRRCNRDKSTYTPEEWEAARLGRGAAWPPPSRLALITDLAEAVGVDALPSPSGIDRDLADEIIRYIDHVHRDGADDEERDRLAAIFRGGGRA
ncbi:hypothetical protein G6010_05335 [Dietzia sp. SLG510A3-3B2-2]|nr:hypothetical protein [Dietzia sp. SLG510A3-40A3]MBB1009018.1 hypothetical protein [Dietzia sp. SLG510A3-3B2-2]